MSYLQSLEEAQPGHYRTIYADPPWMERGAGQSKRGADRHYALMPTEDICALPVSRAAGPDAHLYLWVTNNFLMDGFVVVKAWGFRYITLITWAKDRIGLGQYFRGQTEHCLFAVRGSLPYRSDGGGAHSRLYSSKSEPERALAQTARDVRDHRGRELRAAPGTFRPERTERLGLLGIRRAAAARACTRPC